MTKMRIIFRLFLLCAAFSAANALTCEPCDKHNCETPTCQGGFVPDPCRCCFVCAKQMNESCGGMYAIHGQCDMALSCIIQPSHGELVTGNEPGFCKPTSSVEPTDLCHQTAYYDGCDIVGQKCECGRQIACSNPHQFQNKHQCLLYMAKQDDLRQRCTKTLCSVQHSPTCPDDSVLEEGYAPPGECCPLPSRCVCSSERCPLHLCRPGFDRVLVTRGTNRPGSCCDVYECRPQEEIQEIDECAAVRCAYRPLASITCSNDSVPVKGRTSPNNCCPGPTCKCEKDKCAKPTCSAGTTVRVSFRGDGKPGSCCDVYVCSSDAVLAGCSVNGTLHVHGSSYERDGCRVCDCENGVSYCQLRKCPNLPCSLKTMRQGDCCPTCVDDGENNPVDAYVPYPMCKSDDGSTVYQVGDQWKTDACTECRCEEGGIRRCKAAMCKETLVTITAPVCPSLGLCPLQDADCPYGFKYDDQGCRTCQCVETLCPSLSNCKISCPRGFQKDDDGCSMCKCRSNKCRDLTSCTKECPYGYKKNKHGCDKCRCKRCPQMQSCAKECRYGLETNTYGCTICKCKAQQSPATPVAKPVAQTCTDSSSNRKRDDGETWSSGCYICFCRGGHVMCDILECPVLDCRNPVHLSGQCCPVCESEAFDNSSAVIPLSVSCQEPGGAWRTEGETWQVDHCTSCTCQSGNVMCTSAPCPPIACANPIRRSGECCPTCPGLLGDLNLTSNALGTNCLDGADVYESGTLWRADMCTSCACLAGNIKCYSETCPTIHDCKQPVLKHGRCCPECLETGFSRVYRTCSHGDMLREHGDSWTTSEPCRNCSCLDGEVKCTAPKCPDLSHCINIKKSPGVCCDLCQDEKSEPGDDKDDDHDVPEPAAAGFNGLPIAIGICGAVVAIVAVVVIIICVRRRASATNGSKEKSAERKSVEAAEPAERIPFNRLESTTTTRTALCSTSSHPDEHYDAEQRR